jgi:hypothetical protein
LVCTLVNVSRQLLPASVHSCVALLLILTTAIPGLFAPRHGQQYRDDQRRRRSQFDRGTTAAENEARFEGLFDPARVSHSILDPRPFGAAPFGRAVRLPYI